MTTDNNHQQDPVKELNSIQISLTKLLEKIAEALKRPDDVTTEVLESIKETVTETLKSNKTFNDKVFVKKTESLARIAERLDRVKEKLEAGGLKANDAARLGIEYGKLKKAYDKLIDLL